MSKELSSIPLKRRTILKAGLAIGAMQVASPFVVKALADDTVKIGLDNPLTGTFAALGKNELIGATLAVDQINAKNGILGRKVELLVEDSTSGDTATAVAKADKLIDKGGRIAAHMMEAASNDVVFEAGKFVIAGTDRSVSLDDVAKHSFHSAMLPNDIETGFTERANFGPAGSATFPSGAHLCEVEIDAETGEVTLTRYTAVDDCGRILNPLLCEGQIHGGIVQGIGQVLMENIVYDA